MKSGILTKALQTVNAIVTQRDLYPILENVKICVEKDQLSLKATDLSIRYLFMKAIATMQQCIKQTVIFI